MGANIKNLLGAMLLTLYGQQFDGFARGIPVMLGRPLGKRHQAGIVEGICHIGRRTLREIDVFVHQLVLYSRLAIPEQTQQYQRNDAMIDFTAHEIIETSQGIAIDSRRGGRQSTFYLVYQLVSEIFVGIQSQDPLGGNRKIVQRPLKLLGM